MAMDLSKFLAGVAEGRRRQLEAAVQVAHQFVVVKIEGDAQQMTPVATGFLQGSATTLDPVVQGEIVRIVTGFNAEYGAAVHEDLDANHSVGQAKFLSTAMERNAPGLMPYVASKTKAAGF